MMTDDELRLINEYLDGEADPAAAATVRGWVSSRDEAAAALRQAKAERAGRDATFAAASLDEDDAAVDRILTAVRQEQLRDRAAAPIASRTSALRLWAPRVAAVLIVGVAGASVGYFTGGTSGGGGTTIVSSPMPVADGYAVHVMDRDGTLLRTVNYSTRQAAETGRADLVGE